MSRNCRKFDEDFKQGAVQLVTQTDTAVRARQVAALPGRHRAGGPTDPFHGPGCGEHQGASG